MKERQSRRQFFTNPMASGRCKSFPHLFKTWSKKRINKTEMSTVFADDLEGVQQGANVGVFDVLLSKVRHDFKLSIVSGSTRAHDFQGIVLLVNG